MKAQINIKTPAGQSLQGFPVKMTSPLTVGMLFFDVYFYLSDELNHDLHEGDTITITILP